MTIPSLGMLLHTYFEDRLKAQKGLRPATIGSYRDTVRLFLMFVAKERRCRLTRLKVQDLTADRVVQFLKMLENERNNHIRSRNQRLVALRSFFDCMASQAPEMWQEAERVNGIPTKRAAPPRTFYLERDEIETLFAGMEMSTSLAFRDCTLLLFLYNTGARVQEVADLRVANLELSRNRVHLHGKGDKWRVCPLWKETCSLLGQLIKTAADDGEDQPVFMSQRGRALTRFGIYKIVRRHTRELARNRPEAQNTSISPHLFRHSTAVHLLEAGVDQNVIRNWLGHVSLETTNRYTEITLAMKEKALEACTVPTKTDTKSHKRVIWRDDPELLEWLKSL